MRRTQVLLATSLVLVACGGDPNPLGPEDSHFEAVIQGTTTEHLNSEEGFLGYGSSPDDGQPTFYMNGAAEDAGVVRAITIRRFGGGRLGVGEYEVELIGSAEQNKSGVKLEYRREATEVLLEGFAADSGVIVITSSSEDVVEGRFQVSAFRHCELEWGRYGWGGSCFTPSTVPEDAPRVNITGNFRAVRPDVDLN